MSATLDPAIAAAIKAQVTLANARLECLREDAIRAQQRASQQAREAHDWLEKAIEQEHTVSALEAFLTAHGLPKAET